MLQSLSAALAEISLPQLALIAGIALIASVIGGVAGYGTGVLLPLVLVPIVGAEPVVPIISLSALLTNTGRAAAFWGRVDGRRVVIVLLAAVPTCVLGAWGYTMLTGKGAALVIGAMLVATVPLRRLMRRRGLALSSRGLAAASFGKRRIISRNPLSSSIPITSDVTGQRNLSCRTSVFRSRFTARCNSVPSRRPDCTML